MTKTTIDFFNTPKVKNQLTEFATENLPVNRMIAIAKNCINNNPKLANFEPMDFYNAIIKSFSVGLEPDTTSAHAYLIPYGNQIQFQLGYRGLVELVKRSNTIEGLVESGYICENDTYEYIKGDNPVFQVKPALTNRGEVIAYYATVKINESQRMTEVMDINDIAKIKAQVKGNSPAWANFEHEMARKSVIKRLCKHLPLAPVVMNAIKSDDEIYQENVAIKVTKISEEDYNNIIHLTDEKLLEKDGVPLTIIDICETYNLPHIKELPLTIYQGIISQYKIEIVEAEIVQEA